MATSKIHTIQWASGLNMVLGAWLVVSPTVFGDRWMAPDSLANSVFAGILVFLLGAFRANGAYRSAWMSWLSALLGAWVFVSPWVYFYSNNEARAWNSFLVGGAIAVLGIVSAIASEPSRPRTEPGAYRPSAPSRV